MGRGVEPVTELGHSRRGACSLCGLVGALTLTHVPPGCAGNAGAASHLCKVTDDQGVVQFINGRERLGGLRFYSQCRECNGDIVSRYDGEWPLWSNEILRRLDRAGRRVPDAGFPMVLPGRRPGAFVRSVLAGMFALTPTLRLGWPDLADAIRTGASMGAPDELHLLMHLYSGPHRFVTSGIGKATLPLQHPASASLEPLPGEDPEGLLVRPWVLRTAVGARLRSDPPSPGPVPCRSAWASQRPYRIGHGYPRRPPLP